MTLRKDLALLSDWIEPGSRVLDLGCGDGSLLMHLRDTRDVTGYGIEIDNDNIVNSVTADIDVIQTDLDAGLVDFGDDSFDYVIMTQTLQAIRRPDELLLEMLRVGREGIVTFPNFGHYKSRIQLGLAGHMPVYRSLPHKWYNTPNIHLCTFPDFEQLCDRFQIEILARSVVDNDHRASLGTRLLPNLLGEIAQYRLRRVK